MRIIAGELKGRVFNIPKGQDVRPTTDRSRESLFNILISNNILEVDAKVLDLFAGSGALSFEAISRGASHSTMIEKDRKTYQSIIENAQKLGISDKLSILHIDAIRYFENIKDFDYDLIFIDPPYKTDLLNKVINIFSESSIDRVFYLCIEHSIRDVFDFNVEKFEIIKEKKISSSYFKILKFIH